ncbi:MAG TPA: Uma2 family endonuclease [Chromatiales bacterium]|nr:Uma2 family endonuclease [Chromatiales bacterium]
MAPQLASDHPISVDEYLAGERDGEVRHEYVGGHVYAMTGASARHALIVTALTLLLGPRARERRCQLFTNDMKVHIRTAGEDAFYYPDLLLSCDPQDRAEYYRERPCLIVEVLSEATERIDRMEKRYAYTTLASLHEYVLVSQDRPRIEIYRRTGDDWTHEIIDQDTFRLDCLDLEIPLEAVYQDVADEIGGPGSGDAHSPR